MPIDQAKNLRKYGYDILINRFEPLLRNVLIYETLLLNYGAKNWPDNIPQGVINTLLEEKEVCTDDVAIEDYFDELYLLQLKEIAIFKNNFSYVSNLVDSLSKDKFIKLMDELNRLRIKIAHAKSTFSQLDFTRICEIVRVICCGDLGKELLAYIENESYKVATDLPLDFYIEEIIPNNLPTEEYDLDGGFVGRNREKEYIKKLLYSEQDRIITITGAGGVGKTAVALKTSYDILSDYKQRYDAIIWFSAKESKLTHDKGIVDLQSQISNCKQLTIDILEIIDPKTAKIFMENSFDLKQSIEYLYNLFSYQKCLIIIDNLETIRDEDTITFIKDIPRPSQTLITSRKGLGEIERRYPLPEMSEKDAITLFRLIAKEKNRIDLLKLDESHIKNWL